MKINKLRTILIVLLTVLSIVCSFGQGTNCELQWSRFKQDTDFTTTKGKALTDAIDKNPGVITSWWVFDEIQEVAYKSNIDELNLIDNYLKTSSKKAEVLVKEIKEVGSYAKWKDVNNLANKGGNVLDAADIAKLRANRAAHTIERHGFEVTDDLLKRRATEGIAPDGSSIAKKQGRRRIGNVIPPMSSKFRDAASMKKALNAVDESREAFQNALRAEQAMIGSGRRVEQFKFQVDLGETIGLGYKRPAGTPNYVLAGERLSGIPIKADGLTKIEVRYKLNRTTGKYEINTMFPIE